MPKFVFNLKGVYRHRRMIQDQRERETAVAAQAAKALEDELRMLHQTIKEANVELLGGHLSGSIDTNYLAAHRRFILSAERKGVQLMQRIALARRNLDIAREKLVEATKRTKIIEKLRERRLAEWKQGIKRKEFAELDEAGMRIANSLDAQAVLEGMDVGGEE
jgi:flagellar protein FliJ